MKTNKIKFGISYADTGSSLHAQNGITKFILFMAWVIMVLTRIKNVARILGPLIFSSLDRADVISNAMTLRGFGRNKKRTCYSLKPMTKADFMVLAVITIVLVLGFIRRSQSEQLFWYPF